MTPSPCPGCGLVLPEGNGATHAYLGASPACWALYNRVLAREYGDQAYWPAHRMSVDVYAAQHPGVAERRTIRSINVHLVGLHLALDRGWSDDRILYVIKRLATLPVERMAWYALPDFSGTIKVDSLVEIDTPDRHITAVRAWATSVWVAWREHHDAIRRLANAM